MLLEIKKEKGKFILMNPPENASDRFFVEVSKIFDKETKKSKGSGKAFKEINRLAKKYPGNKFLAISSEMTPPDYQTSDLSDTDQLLNEALKKKYGI